MPDTVFRILTINLGSTSTKVAVWENEKLLAGESIQHPPEKVKAYKWVYDQTGYRKECLDVWLKERGFDYGEFDIFVTRGGNVHAVPGGIYMLNPDMIREMQSGRYGTHPNGIGNVISYNLGQTYGKPAIFIDPPVTDEYWEWSRLTGIPEITNQSSFHALNQKETARKIAHDIGKTYAEARLIICHLGGGISVGAHIGGMVVDCNNALDGDGPMSPERAGTVPTGSLIDMCFSGAFDHGEMRKKITGHGGWWGHLGTTDAREVVKRMKEGDAKAKLVFETTCYQTAKCVGAMAAAMDGKVDAIGLTGSIAHSPDFVDCLKKKTSWIAPFHMYPGENEMEALCAGALRYLRDEEKPAEFIPDKE